MKDISISLCMIVKNEADHLENCLNSVKDLVDEIIIVDTGSTDETVEICKRFTDQVHYYQWDQSFSNARNYSIQFATSDWILILDADEAIQSPLNMNLKSRLAHIKGNIVSIQTLNYFGDHISPDNLHVHFQNRLFRNNKGFKFKNRIHETLIRQEEEIKSITLDPQILHYGYLDQVTKKKNKHHKNIELLKLEETEKSHSPWIQYHLAVEYYRNKDFKKAFHYVNYSIERFVRKGSIPPSRLYKLKYSIILDTGNVKGAWPSINLAIQLYPDYVDLYYYKGMILYELEEYKDAIDLLQYCLILGESHPKYLILKGVGSFRAQELRDKCMEKIKSE